MVDACNSLAIPFVQISTDHYYDGDSSLLHDECYPLKILNYYAKTKKDGEDFALSYPGSLILRTNITGFRKNNTGSSFVEWLIDSLLSSDSFPLFTDYYTSTIDCLSFCSIAYKLFSLSASGIYNVASSQCLSKYEFGILFARLAGLDSQHIRQEKASVLKTPRARSLGLNCTKTEKLLNITMPTAVEVSSQLIAEAKSHGRI